MVESWKPLSLFTSITIPSPSQLLIFHHTLHNVAMYTLNLHVAVVFCAITAAGHGLLADITKIQRYWGQISSYADNPEDYFSVEYVGLPDSC